MKTIIAFLAVFVVNNISQTPSLSELHFLAGTWKVENKESYEAWHISKDGSLQGNSYKIRENKRIISEYLTIKSIGDNIIYSAQVINQNNGMPVQFTRNRAVTDKFSFENLQHDFPKKIQYTKFNNMTLHIAVLGDDGKGFSYTMFKERNSEN